MKIKYDSNNSGGGWWLKDEDWKALEAAGWKVDWYSQQENKMFVNDAGDRCLGALATSASKDFPSFGDAIREWEKITGQDASDEGCNCCGAPHAFRVKDADKYEYASGEQCLQYLYPDVPKSLREAVERLNG
jgi:hypothetical protein